MKRQLDLDGEYVFDLLNEDVEEPAYEVVEHQLWGEWRWGVEMLLVLKDSDGRYWQTVYREQTGDVYYNSLQEESLAEFYEVEPYDVTVTRFRIREYDS